MPNENANPVWATQASTSQSWSDFVLDFGDMWDSSALTSESSSNSEIDTEWISDSITSSDTKNELDLDLNKKDFLDENKKLDAQWNNINIADLDTIISDTQNDDFDISLDDDNNKSQETKNENNDTDFSLTENDNKISEETENAIEKNTENGISIDTDNKIVNDNESDVSDDIKSQTNLDETMEEASIDGKNFMEDEPANEDDAVDNINASNDDLGDTSEDFSISLDKEWDFNNATALNESSNTWRDDSFDAQNQSDTEESIQESGFLVDNEDTNDEKNQHEKSWPIELTQDSFNDEKKFSDNNLSWEDLDSDSSSSSIESMEINDNNSLNENNDNKLSDITAENPDSQEDDFEWNVLNDENNSSDTTSDYNDNDSNDINDQIKQPELSDLLWNDSSIDFSWESLDDSAQEEINDVDNSDSISEKETSNELDINDQTASENTEVNANIEDDVKFEDNANDENSQDANFTFDYPENDVQTELTDVNSESLWDKKIEQNSNSYDSDVINTDSYNYNSDSLNNWDNENLVKPSESAFVDEAAPDTESQANDSSINSNTSKVLDSSPDENSLTNNAQEISSTLSLDQILDSELNNNPQLSDNSKASPNNVNTDSWLLKNKKVVILSAWIWILLAWFVVVLAFPSKNTGTSDTIQDTEIKEYQGISDDQVDDYDHQVAADDQYISDQESSDESEGGDSDYVNNKPSAWWIVIDIPQDFWTDSGDTEDITQETSSQTIVEPYVWCENGDLDCDADFNEDEEVSNTLSIEEITPEIERLKAIAENYHSLWYTNRDKILIKYASQAINLCDKYKQQIDKEEMVDEESFDLFKAEFNSIHHKMDSYIWSGNEVETYVQGNFDEEYDFEDKDEVRDFINKKANWLI